MKTVLERNKIREIFLAHGFEIKPGCDDLKPYVYEAAEALIAAIIQKLSELNGTKRQ